MAKHSSEESTLSQAGSVQAFKDAFARHAAGVAILTSRTPEGDPVGFTATSLASLSAEPPRATFNMAQSSSSWPAMQPGNYVAIHFLGVEAAKIARKFAVDTEDRFAGDHWHNGPHDLPIVDGNTAVLVTKIAAVIPQVNNAIIVLDILEGQFESVHQPLLYHQRRFHALDTTDLLPE